MTEKWRADINLQMNKLSIILHLLILLLLPTNYTKVKASWDALTSRTGYSQETGNSTGSKVYLPVVSNEEPPTSTSPYRINARYLSNSDWMAATSIFWFGHLSLTDNYIDTRVGYSSTELIVRLTAFDRLLFYDPTPSTVDLTNYDSAALYLRTGGLGGGAPDSNTFKFVAQQIPFNLDITPYKASYRGDGSGWQTANISFSVTPIYRGGGFNNYQYNQGWLLTFKIPYSSLGLNGQPAAGTVWSIAAEVFDRDDPTSAIRSMNWPPDMSGDVPSKWAQLGYGLPQYQVPPYTNVESISIRRGLNTENVPDASVGGSSVCGLGVDNYFADWGNKPESFYASSTVDNTQFNIQNQSDVSDFPCFSKYYLTFPLDALPAGKVIVSAKLVLYEFGDAGGPEDSLIHVATTSGDWDETTLTWNNAPLAFQNFAATWVAISPDPSGHTDIRYEWTITPALIDAYSTGESLRLVLYSSDEATDSGKYFWASNRDQPANARPTLIITYGDPVR